MKTRPDKSGPFHWDWIKESRLWYFYFRQEVSDLKDEDFVKAAQEYKQKHSALASRQAKQNQATSQDNQSIWKQPTTYLLIASGVGICLLGIGVYWKLRKKSK